MNTISEKRIYSAPNIDYVKLDTEISLVLMSGGNDPGDPGTTSSKLPDYFNNDPFKSIAV